MGLRELVKVNIPYGKSELTIDIPTRYSIEVIEPRPFAGKETHEISNAMMNPIGTKRIADFVDSPKSAVIVVNDITRPVPSKEIVSALLGELRNCNVKDEYVTILVATGVHRQNTEIELRGMLGDSIVNRTRVVNHESTKDSSMVTLGATKRGVPVIVDRAYVDADIKILTGLIRPHQLAGFSGGRKSVIPGIACEKSVRLCHSFPIRGDLHGPMLGVLEGNIFHEETMEAARMARVDFIVNVVTTGNHEVVEVVAGDLEKAWLKGVRTSEEMSKVKFSEFADIVIASPGGYPGDINLWQAQKAVSAAELIVKKNGVIILVARCEEGSGNVNMALKRASSPREVIEKFVKNGYVDEGLSKAFLYARALERAKIIVVNEGLSKDEMNAMHMECARSPEEALDLAYQTVGKEARIAVVPHAADIIPFR